MMIMVRWNLDISEHTDQAVLALLQERGEGRAELPRFVQDAIDAKIYWEIQQKVWDRNRDLSPEEAQKLADEAVASARADRS